MRKRAVKGTTRSRSSEHSGNGDGFDSESSYTDAPVDIAPKEVNLSGEPDKLPNTLIITVIQARQLPPTALRTAPSCYVKLASMGREHKTSVMTRTVEPTWNETFSFRAVDWASPVVISVRDRASIKMRYIGQVRVSAAELSTVPGMARRRWMPLQDKNWDKKVGESEIELKMALIYTKRYDPNVELESVLKDEEEAGAIGIVVDQEEETEEEALVRRRELERQERERKNVMYSNLKQGDYQVQVHIIEARDLKGENLSGTSDPYCQVEVLSAKKKTSTKYDTLGCVFDEILFFNFKNIGRDELKQASIKISVFDKETLLKDKLIGTYQLDCLSVYCRTNHELYRQWVAVHDYLSDKDRGVQGFLLVTVIVIGPGDSFIVHDREEELAQEMLASAAALGPSSNQADAQSLVLLPPSIDLKLNFLLVKVFRAEGLPAMDEGGLLGSSGIDAYVQIGFSAHSTCRSSVVTVKGSADLSPEFLEELWIPVMTPTLSRNISISLWDRDLATKDELVGISSWDYQQVALSTSPGGIASSDDSRVAQHLEAIGQKDDDLRERVELRWFNLYGPPLRNVSAKRAQAVMQHPDFGSTYRGRLLLSMERVESPAASEGEKFHLKRMKEWTPNMNTQRDPKTIKYSLRCALFCGVDVPHIPSFSMLSSSTKVRVTVAIGSYEIRFDPEVVAKDGCVTWETCREKWPIVLPADLTQLPDVIITLSRRVDKDEFVSVSYARLSSIDLFTKGFASPSSSKPQWIALREEETRRQTKYALEKTQSPGSLLMSLGFGREEVAARHQWSDDAFIFTPLHENLAHREVRVHIFQFRKLVLPVGRIRAPNPFVSVRCCGQMKKTGSQLKTFDPLFYETLVFAVRIPEDLSYSPDLLFQVHDASISNSTSSPGAVLGELRMPMAKAVKSVANAPAPRPRWFKLSAVRRQSSTFVEEYKGDALISVQYIDHAGPIESMGHPESITPEYQEAKLEIMALGVRKLKALSLLGIQHPHVEFELSGGLFSDGTTVRKTKPSTSLNGKNANFLDCIVANAKLPVDTLFAPQLEIKVCEYGIGGLRKSVLASCKLNLASKLPWSSEFVPPQHQQAFENPATGIALPTKTVETVTSVPKKREGKLSRLFSSVSRKERAARKENEKRIEALPIAADSEATEGLGLLSGDEDGDATPVGDGDLIGEEAEEEEEADDGMGVGDLDLSLAFKSSRMTSTFADMRIDAKEYPAQLEETKKESERQWQAGEADLLLLSHDSSSQSHTIANTREIDGVKPPPYMDGRDWWIGREYGGEELEKFLQVKALETYTLHRSVLTRPSLLKRKRVHVDLKAGVFKGLIRVVEKRSWRGVASNDGPLLDIERLREPQQLVVRVYVLRASSLQSKDSNGYSDPYLRLKLGKDIISDRANHKKKTLNPEFFKMFSFNAVLPGPSQLEIAVWDHDLLTDDLIGRTTIDLEDRWFHRDWQRIGQGHPKLAEAGGCLKPVEYRHLYTEQRSTSQGVVQLWLDIMSAQQAAQIPPVDIDPPIPRKFEVRVIVWRGEGIVDQDRSEINDYFVKVWMEGGKCEATDVHWRCSNGKPCWNWRIKLPIEFPLRTAEFGRLHIQLWDKDVLKWNDMIGEAQLDLYKWIRRAYESNRSVSPFLELRRQRTSGAVASSREDADTGVGVESSSSSEEEIASDQDQGQSDIEGEYGGGNSDFDPVPVTPREKDGLLAGRQRHQESKAKSVKVPKKTFARPTLWSKPSAADLKKTQEAKQKSEAKAALNSLLDFLGLGELPEDAEWISLHYTDREAAISMDLGRLGISVQIVPEKEAAANPVGEGQGAPNVNPYLPPPVGRFRLSANPLAMFKELVGPKMCLRITVLCCCVGCMLFISVFGATIMSTLTYLQAMENSHQEQTVAWQLPPNATLSADFQLPP